MKILEGWLRGHDDYPYPTKQQFKELSKLTGMSNKQVRVWFTNYRYVREIMFIFSENSQRLSLDYQKLSMQLAQKHYKYVIHYSFGSNSIISNSLFRAVPPLSIKRGQ